MDYSDRPGHFAMYVLHRLRHGNVTPNTEWGLNHPALAATLTHAERKGYVKFIKKSHRKRFWVITEAGKDIYDKYKGWFRVIEPDSEEAKTLDPWGQPIYPPGTIVY